MQCLKRPEEGDRFPGAGLVGSCALPGIGVETELRSSERIVYILNYLATATCNDFRLFVLSSHVLEKLGSVALCIQSDYLMV